METFRRHREKLFFLMFAGAIGIMLLIVNGYRLIEFSDSTAFCGRLCHNVMNSEYIAYQASPHSRVLCSQCHVGPGADYLVKSKVSGVPLILATLKGDYDRPIAAPVENLRPARETCEQCHRPEKFSGDKVIVHATYAADEQNTRKVDTRVLRVGGGESKVASGIHWHIAANVYYLPMDKARQNISWVGVEGKDGTLTQYVDTKQINDITPEKVKEAERLMDCVDCHNRATHIFQSPSELIDTAMEQGEIDSRLPFIKREGVKALDPVNPSLEQAIARVEAIRGFYQTNYPQSFKQSEGSIDEAIDKLKNIARLTTFPEMKVNWDTYPSNAGHQDSPGCFRCHGKLVAYDGAEKGKTIDATCESCHYFSLQQIK
ncbi:MAG: NapC/NirT family cytochrome c [Dehalococcoidales bacterium]|nr:NapC/NirT family cytochrome c [Dehalococcoidales bacterium]